MLRKTKFLESWQVTVAYTGWISKEYEFAGKCSYCF